MAYKLASIGFSSNEQKMIQHQLAVLRNSMGVAWEYVGDQVTPAHLTLSRTPDPAAAQRIIGLVAFPRGCPHSALQFDWPLTVMGVMNLLNKAKDILANKKSSAFKKDSQQTLQPDPVTALKRLLRIHAPSCLSVRETTAYIYPSLDSITSNTTDNAGLLQILRENTFRLTTTDVPATPPEWPLNVSLKAILWSLALQEGPPDKEWFKAYQSKAASDEPIVVDNEASTDAEEPPASLPPIESSAEQSFRLGRWPFFGQWETSPEYMRLAALYTRKAATIAEGSHFAVLEAAKVESFLYACGICDLQLTCEAQTAAPAPSPVVEKRPEGGWLSRLRTRLGLRAIWGRADRTREAPQLF